MSEPCWAASVRLDELEHESGVVHLIRLREPGSKMPNRAAFQIALLFILADYNVPRIWWEHDGAERTQRRSNGLLSLELGSLFGNMSVH